MIEDTIFLTGISKREDCVSCPPTLPTCTINCKKNEECVLRSASCSKCAEYYCSPVSSKKKSIPVGGIVGGIVGGFVFLALIAGFLFYYFVYRKKRPFLEDEDDIIMGDVDAEYDKEGDYTISQLDSISGEQRPAAGPIGGQAAQQWEKPPGISAAQRPSIKDRRVSSYESFTRINPRTTRGGARRMAAKRRARQKQRVQAGTYPASIASDRRSLATSLSTAASNILPIAYIPGVTVRPTKNNTRLIYSHEDDSIFSDLNALEEASIVGTIRSGGRSEGLAGSGSTEARDRTMTAIKAQPKLVNVDRIEEGDEDEDEDYDYTSTSAPARNDGHNGFLSVPGGLQQNSSSSFSFANTSHQTGALGTLSASPGTSGISGDSDSDSDVDSDIGEIQRATSVRQPLATSTAGTAPPLALQALSRLNRLGREVLINTDSVAELSALPPPTNPAAVGGHENDSGSFILDVEYDGPPRSPFSDPSDPPEHLL